MDANLMIKYIDYFNSNRSRALTMLIYDSFRGNLEESIKKKFHDSNIDLAVIPGGLTSICQPLDVAINKPFKDNLRKEWHLWMAGGDAGQTIGGNLRRAKFGDVCGWVKRSWEQISDEIIINSFKTYHILDTLDDLNISDDDSIDNSDKDDVSDNNVSIDDIE